ncbi:MAG TPA: DUF4288 domain-containing protein [Candidatus Binatia bacterium]|jgi:hypothetical protein|nr:DUF4288 domain-containing protein [Candidatus Binatia bacterium]
MKDSKNISPHGWYVGSYLLRFIELSNKHNHRLESKFLTWENTVIVKARNLNHAYDRISSIAKRQTKPYKGGLDAIDVQWLFEGITELLSIYEKLGDGAEIMWSEHRPQTLKQICKRVRKKGEFHQ